MLDVSFKLPAELKGNISSNEALVFDALENLLMNAYVPGVEALTELAGPSDISIAHHETDVDMGLEGKGSRLILKDAWEGKISRDLYHLLYSATRVKLLEHGLYSVHAACAGDEGQVLIVGHSGSGKTSTALELVRSKDWKLASGNKTVVTFDQQQNIQVVAGTSTMTVRDHDGERYATPLGKEIESYGGRIAFSLDESHYVSVSERPLKAIVVVRLHDGLRDAHEMNPVAAMHTLYPYFMDTVNADTIVAGGKGVFRGTAPEGSSEQLSRQLSGAVSKIPVISVAGPLSYVVDTVSSL